MKKQKKRKVEVVVISDIHLGTFGCRSKELLNYLKTINPNVLILNGDIIDIWQFNKRYFPKSHMKVIKYITSLLSKGTRVVYITGNHDELLRKFVKFQIGSFELVNKLVLELDGEKAWFFHGDVFDFTMKTAKWAAKLGGMGYDFLIMLNTVINWFSEKILGRGRISLSKKIKNSVKSALKHINNFEETAAEIAISNNYQYVVCGHIHQPQYRTIVNKAGESVIYMNSGDWIENLTALEYNEQEWSIYEYAKDPLTGKIEHSEEDLIIEKDLSKADSNQKEIFTELLAEFQMVNGL